MSDNFTAELLRELENSLSQSDDEEVLRNVKYTIISGLRENSEVMWAYEQNQLYYQNSYSAKTQLTSYTCRVKECKARVFVRPNKTAFQDMSIPHLASHGSQYQDYKFMYCDSRMKERAKSAPASMSPYEIYMEAVAE